MSSASGCSALDYEELALVVTIIAATVAMVATLIVLCYRRFRP